MTTVSVFAPLRHADFARYLVGRFTATIAWQMMGVAVGWQVYTITRDPLALGFVGLAQFLPFVVLILPAGQLADRADRRLVMVASYVIEALCALAMLTFTLTGATDVRIVYAVMALFGAGRAFWMPTGQAMVPNLVPVADFPRAVGLHTTLFQCAVITGPAIGGLLYVFGAEVVYGTAFALLLVAMLAMALIAPRRSAHAAVKYRLADALDGLRFVLHRRNLFGAISLDLFAVLFGGATALLPVFASDVLHVGPAGLGVLRAAPGVGAALTAVVLAANPISRHPGRWMFGGVAIFGAATVVFGLSESFPLSLVALFALGAGDMVSVFVRHLLVQLETPDAIRGRVSAVSAMFIGASNELGEFESGVTAKWFGAVRAVVIGGLATLAVVGAYLALFPTLRTMARFPHPAASPATSSTS